MSDSRRQLLDVLQSKARDGLPLDDAVGFLSQAGVALLDAIKIIREVYKIPLGEAKMAVSLHPDWAGPAAEADLLHGEILSAIDAGEDFDVEIVATPAATELQAFASWFHQDWRLVFADFPSGAKLYIDGLTSGRRDKLARQLRAFLDDHREPSSDTLREAWFAQGAQAWPSELDIVTTLHGFLDLAEGGTTTRS